MEAAKIAQFMALAGQRLAGKIESASPEERKLGAALLLSEVLEYVVHGLGVIPEFNGTKITEPNQIKYTLDGRAPDEIEMIDGLADVAYTMYWNAQAFGIPLEEAFELVCDNNLEKFVLLDGWKGEVGPLEREEWHCGRQVTWPKEVVGVEVIEFGNRRFGVGKDSSGKVRKPSTYRPVDLSGLVGSR